MNRRDLMLLAASPVLAKGNARLFRTDNLAAWCIVPFDAAQRGPEERAAMLRRLGLTRLAYDWREKDIPTFDQELDALRRHRIRLEAFWLASDLNTESNPNVKAVLDFLRRRRARTAIWLYVTTPKAFDTLSQEEKVEKVAAAVGYVARKAQELNCTVDLYNHGGWTGEPENQIAVIRRLRLSNLGIVYNFHHAREQMDRFPALFEQMLPYLRTLNLNGMKRGGPMIMTIGDGDRELEMLRVVWRSRYRGRIGILNHRTDVDAEIGLRGNMEGLRRLVAQLERE